MIQESAKNLKMNGLVAQAAFASASVNADHLNKVVGMWNDYVSLELGYPLDSLGNTISSTVTRDEEMMKEYAQIQHIRPKLTMDDRGFYVVSGMNI